MSASNANTGPDLIDILQQSKQLLNQSEQIGIETARQLQQQGQRIKTANNKLSSVNTNIKASSSILNKLKSWWK